MLPKLSALVAQPTKIVVGSNPDPASPGSQFGVAGSADKGTVVVVVLLGADVEDGLTFVGVVVDADVLDARSTSCGVRPHPARNASATRQHIPRLNLTTPL
jgi:hypothetical protein